MRKFATASILMLGLGMWGCSGSGYSNGSTASPMAPTPINSNGGGVVTIDVVAVNGAQSFSPNPATLPPGQMVVWHNVNNTTHRVVLNDRSVDTGDLAPWVTSRALTPSAAGANYHCSIHPAMVGAIGSAQGEPPPMGPAY